MPKFRDYTGLERTPQSMAWLIRERAKLKGLIERRQRQLDELPREILELQTKLNALDLIIPLHEVKVDPQVIKGTRPREKSLAPFGVMTSVIYRVLKEAKGEPRSSSEIALEFMREIGMPVTRANRVHATERVRRRLKAMSHAGSVERHHDLYVRDNSEGLWSLPKNGWAADDEDDQEPMRKAA